jgi:hypothetical protein
VLDFPNIRKRVYKTAKRSWEEVYKKMLEIIQKEKMLPQPKAKK